MSECNRCIELEAEVSILRFEKAQLEGRLRQLEEDNESLIDSIGRVMVTNLNAMVNAFRWKSLAAKLKFKNKNVNVRG